MLTVHKHYPFDTGLTSKKPGSHLQTRNLSLNPNRCHLYRHHSSSSSLANPTLPLLYQKSTPPSPPLMLISLSRPKYRSLTNPSLIHLFSSSSSTNTSDAPSEESASQSDTSSKSFSFSDVKASLKQKHEQNPPGQSQERKPNFSPFRRPGSVEPSLAKPPSRAASLEEIKKNLAEYRLRSSVPPTKPGDSPPTSQSAQQQHQPISLQDLYERHVNAQSNHGHGNSGIQWNNDRDNKQTSGKLSFDAIRESLRQMRVNKPSANANVDRKSGEAISFSSLRNSLKLKSGSQNEPVKSTVIGGTEGLPVAIFGKETAKEDGSAKEEMSTEFVYNYSFAELGEKLRILRPEVKGEEKAGFSLEELNERLRKLREMERKETEARIGGVTFNDLRESLVRMKISNEDKSQKTIQKLNLLGSLGGTPDFMLLPPKEQLVEKYFHPDNMSSEEKLKLELAKVRDEFKMSESDCGSSRVQVAQLTVKIKHLSKVLHKKDKHSIKGLQGMVQRRKKLLKYLRRTDWDSYCMVLSKLGLRDNPDYKN